MTPATTADHAVSVVVVAKKPTTVAKKQIGTPNQATR
jgi:hypothetical protein